MRSAGSATPPDPALPILFIDRNSGGRTFRDYLVKAGIQVKLHDEQFPNKTADEDWLAVVGRLGWLIVTGDNNTTRSPLFVQRLAESQAHMFVLLALNGLSTAEKAKCILEVLPRMRQLSCATKPPALWRIGKDGVARLFDHEKTLATMRRGRRLPPGTP